MATFQVTAESLHRLSGNLSSGERDITAQLNTLRSQVQTLVNEDWQGASSAAFQQLYEDWHTGATKLQQVLDGISQQLAQAATEYSSSDTAVTTAANRANH